MLQIYGSQGVWSTGRVRELDSIMTEGHSQLDVVWQPEHEGGGRERMANGITAYRKLYPDLQFDVVQCCADSGAQTCFVEWRASGSTPDVDKGEEVKHTSFRGVSVLQIQDGLVAQSRVYRGAPEGERALFAQQAQPSTMEP